MRERPTGRVVVIGAGMGGLAAALRLAHAGLDVTVVERMASSGGKMRRVEVAGLAIDSGPTVLTMREVFDELFVSVGEDPEDHLRLSPAGILARHHWRDGTVLDLHADPARTRDAIAGAFGPAEADGYVRFARHAAMVHDALRHSYMEAARPGIAGLVRRAGIRGLPALARIGAFATLWDVVSSHFRDPRLRQLFGRYATYCGASPFAAPGPLALVADVEQRGVWLVEGGMHRLAATIENLARARGATFRFGVEAERIVLRGGRVAALRLADGEQIAADAIVMNGDPSALAAGNLGDDVRHAAGVWAVQQRSLSAVTLSVAARAEGFALTRHNVFFGDDYAGEFDDIFRHGRLPRDPTIYVCAQDRDDGSRNADGVERLFMIVNAPARADTSPLPEAEIERCTDMTMARLEEAGLTLDFASGGMAATSPRDFARMFPATGGAIYGRANHGWLASFRRPVAHSNVPGLYLAGGAVHPGPGLPMAALSGRNAAEAVLADLASITTSRQAAMPGGMSMPSATTAATR
jgi:1-hydroxycarotenoid 3,4-desaturase